MSPELVVGLGAGIIVSPALWPAGKFLAKGPDYISKKLQPEDLKAQAIVEAQLAFPMLLGWGGVLIAMLANHETTTTLLSVPLAVLLLSYSLATGKSIVQKWHDDYI